jgi:hypothetical protein
MTIFEHIDWPEVRYFDPDASIVLVGSRGSGKRSLPPSSEDALLLRINTSSRSLVYLEANIFANMETPNSILKLQKFSAICSLKTVLDASLSVEWEVWDVKCRTY